jgi:hypothetical protein
MRYAENSDCLKKTERPKSIDVGRILRRLEADPDVGLSAKIVNLVWLNLVDYSSQIRRICQVAIVECEMCVRYMRVLIDVIYPLGIEERHPPRISKPIIS